MLRYLVIRVCSMSNCKYQKENGDHVAAGCLRCGLIEDLLGCKFRIPPKFCEECNQDFDKLIDEYGILLALKACRKSRAGNVHTIIHKLKERGEIGAAKQAALNAARSGLYDKKGIEKIKATIIKEGLDE